MSEIIKMSPLCTQDEGREIYFTARHEAQKFRVVFPKSMLDAALSPEASEEDRKTWVATQRHKLGGILSKTDPTPDHLTAVLIEEIE